MTIFIVLHVKEPKSDEVENISQLLSGDNPLIGIIGTFLMLFLVPVHTVVPRCP